MVTLKELEPQFIRYEGRVEPVSKVQGDPLTWRERGCPSVEVIEEREYKIFVPEINKAEGIIFECPLCRNHQVEVTFQGVPEKFGTHNKEGKATRWSKSGSGYHDLTTQPSILIESGCKWHGFITNGNVT